MQSANNTALRTRDVVLDEFDMNAGLVIARFRENLFKISAIVGINVRNQDESARKW